MAKSIKEKAYLENFPIVKNKKESIRHNALKQAWKNRDFEIEMYWKRATYFWAFIAATFAGYLAVLSAGKLNTDFPQAELVLICLGLIFSFAWYLANLGSKKWQENWEHHIDMLEDEITGPIYKTVINQDGFSVSRINIKVSFAVFLIWIVLFFNYLSGDKMYFCCVDCGYDFLAFGLIAITIFINAWMYFDWQRLKFESSPKMGFSYSLHKTKYQD
jgi:hypothetical protein